MTFNNHFLDRLSAEVERRKNASTPPQKAPKAVDNTKAVQKPPQKKAQPSKPPASAPKSSPKSTSIKFTPNSPEWSEARRNRVLRSFDVVSAGVILSSTNHLNEDEFEATIKGLERDLAGGVL